MKKVKYKSIIKDQLDIIRMTEEMFGIKPTRFQKFKCVILSMINENSSIKEIK